MDMAILYEYMNINWASSLYTMSLIQVYHVINHYFDVITQFAL